MRMNPGSLLPKALFSLAALTATTGAALAQGKLEVHCQDQDGKPIKNVQVYLQQLQGQGFENKKTSKKGVATFKEVQGGIYRVVAKREGYDPGLKDLYRLPGDGEHTLQITLEPGDFEKMLFFEDEALQQKVTQLITDAIQDFHDNNLEGAEQKLKESLEIFPTSPDAHLNVGLVYLKGQRWEEAKEALEEAADLLAFYVELGSSGMKERREQVLQTIESIPLQKIAVQTEALMQEKRYAEVLPLFEEMKRLSPDNPDVHYNMSLALAHAERLEEAKDSLAKARAIRPDDEAYKRLERQIQELEESGQSMRAQEAVQAIEKLYRAEKYEQALQEAEKAFQEVKPEYHANLWILNARSHAKLGQADDAIDSYRKAVEMKPEDAGLKEELADVYIAAERYEEGIDLYGEVLKGGDKPADQAFFEMAQGFNRKGKADLAGLLFHRILEINPGFSECYYELGVYYFYEKKDRERAKQMLDRYLEVGQDKAHKDTAQAILTVMEKTQD